MGARVAEHAAGCGHGDQRGESVLGCCNMLGESHAAVEMEFV